MTAQDDYNNWKIGLSKGQNQLIIEKIKNKLTQGKKSKIKLQK